MHFLTWQTRSFVISFDMFSSDLLSVIFFFCQPCSLCASYTRVAIGIDIMVKSMQFVVKQNRVWIQQQRLSLEILDKFLTPRTLDFLISEMRIVENILIGCYESQGNNMCEMFGVYSMNDGNIFHDWIFGFFFLYLLAFIYATFDSKNLLTSPSMRILLVL